MAQRKDPQLDALHQSILRKMQQLPENRTCADCKAPSPRWASTNLGIFICISCSGIHRKLGTHISKVRSITLDTWTPAQIARFQKLGNAKAAAYFEACLPEGFRRPNSSDSMSMEKFIRDKYEKKRYISVENGGLGGASNARELRRATPSNSLGSRNISAKLGPRPLQPAGNYDEIRGRARKSAPLSYADTFRSPAVSGAPPSVTRTHMSSSFKPFLSQPSLAKPGNAIQRASTVREIINMGFSADLAARAAQATEGDLQRAVDWVLANNTTAQQPPKQQVQPLMDLLDFDDSSPPSKANGAMGAAASGSPLKSEIGTKPSGAAEDDFTDFADFGAFESALPATKGVSSTNGPAPQAAPESLSSSIAELYTQGVKSVVVSSVTQLQNVGKNSSQKLPSAVSTPIGVSGSSHWATKSSSMGSSEIGKNQLLTNQSGIAMVSQPRNPHASPRRSPLIRNQIAQVRPESVEGSQGRLQPSVSSAQAASPANSPIQMRQHLPWNEANVSNMAPTPDFSKLGSAGVARPSFSPEATRPVAVKSPDHKSGFSTRDAIPNFTWPKGSEFKPSGKAASKVTTPVPNFETTVTSTTTGGLVPPPPPPLEVQIADGSGVPPPDGPPPASHPNPNHASSCLDAAQQAEKSPTTGETSTNGDRAAGTEREDDDEEDPFAALSMLALSTAASTQKARRGKPVKSADGAQASDTSSAPVATKPELVDLDSLLG